MAQVSEGFVDRFAALGQRREAVDLEAQQGQRAADPVVQFPGDPAAFFVGADRPGRRNSRALSVAIPKVSITELRVSLCFCTKCVGRFASTASNPTSDPRARKGA
ncbi:MAG: hypothetical protein R2705_25140 [Ilumatobacteraceae bacterium]